MNQNAAQAGTASNQLVLPQYVDEVMTQNVMTLRPGDSFSDAVQLMATQHVRHSVVVDEQGRIRGVISDRDVLRALGRTSDWQSKSVSEIMTHDPYVIHPRSAVVDALAQLLERRINCLPVVSDGGQVCGIVTSTDLLKSYRKVLESRIAEER